MFLFCQYPGMIPEATRPWWIVLAYAVAILNAIGFVIGLFGRFDPPATVVFLLATAVTFAGIRIRSTNLVAGSWMIVVGCIPPVLPFWIVVPAVISVVTVTTGLVTGELRLIGRGVPPSSDR